MSSYRLDLDDVGEAGSFHKRGGSYLIRAQCPYRPDLSAIVFQCILNEDNDGAPDCYGLRHPPALDPLADATNDENAIFNPTGANHWLWVGVVAMTPQQAQQAGVLARLDQRLAVRDGSQPQGKFPLLQPPPNQQFYVSTTATVADVSKPATSQARYWNARTVSYAALTPPLQRLGVRFGDFGLAIRVDTGESAGFFYADLGLQNKVGESSRLLFRTFFPGANQENHPVAFIVFPRSAYPYRGSFITNPELAIRTRLWDLSLADNIGTLVGLMASGKRYRDFVVGTDPHDVGPADPATPQSQNIARALQRWGYDPGAAKRRQMSTLFSNAASQMRQDAARLGRLQIPVP